MTSNRTSQAVEQVLQEAQKIGPAYTLMLSAGAGQAIAAEYQRMQEALKELCDHGKDRECDSYYDEARAALAFDPLFTP